jgi:hypothetical protein
MTKGNDKKAEQLGMPIGTASYKLKKSIMFSLLKELNRNWCYRCSGLIETEDTLSVEHKEPWLDSENPKGLFFDLDNISFSHLSCNISDAKRIKADCGTATKYINGCRCSSCKEGKSKTAKKYYSKEKRHERYKRLGS